MAETVAEIAVKIKQNEGLSLTTIINVYDNKSNRKLTGTQTVEKDSFINWEIEQKADLS